MDLEKQPKATVSSLCLSIIVRLHSHDMKSLSIFVAGLMAVFLSSCSTTPKPNYQQTVESDLAGAVVNLAVLKQLDAGHVDKARRIAMIPVYSGMDFVRFCSVRGEVSLTAEEKLKWMKVARETLDYMLRHSDECDSRDRLVQEGMRGLNFFLSEAEDIRRLNELSAHLAQNDKTRVESQKP